MHKKLASDLTSLAHSILKMKNKEDVFALKEKAHEVYEKLALLAYVEEYVNTTPQAKVTKEELIGQLEEAAELKEKSPAISVESIVEDVVEPTIEETVQVIEKQEEVPVATITEEVVVEETEEEIAEIIEAQNIIEGAVSEELPKVALTQEEIEDAIVEEPVFEKVEETPVAEVEETTKEVIVSEEIIDIKEEPVVETKPEKKVEEITEQPFDELEDLLFGKPNGTKDEASFIEETKAPQPTLEDELQDTLPVDVMADLFQKAEPKKTVNDFLQNTIQIGLNDRIAFVKHLFDGDQTDFNRVVSQLNTFKTEREAKNFIQKMVKPDYDWSQKEEYETRFLEIIERRFA